MSNLIELLDKTLFGSSSCRQLFKLSRLNNHELGSPNFCSLENRALFTLTNRPLTWDGKTIVPPLTDDTNPFHLPPPPISLFCVPESDPPPPTERMDFPYIAYPKGPKGKLWNWSFNMDMPNKITELNCISKSMSGMKMTVCESIKWEDPTITVHGKKHTLPLTRNYLVEAFHTNKGIINTKSHYWKVPGSIDKGMLLVFAFQFNKSSNTWVGVEDHILQKDFMPLFLKPNIKSDSTLTQLSIRKGEQVNTLSVTHKVLVCIELICCEAANNFDPIGVLEGAKIHPHTMVISSLPLDGMEANIKIERPATISHEMSGMEGMEGMGEMNKEIKSSLYTEVNDTPIGSPEWDKGFAYHELNPKAGESFVVVDPKKTKRTVKFATMEPRMPLGLGDSALDLIYKASYASTSEVITYARLFYEAYEKLVVKDSTQKPDLPAYKPKNIIKLARQGEFDNIHIAPTMKASDKMKKLLPGWNLDEIHMAPACVHDCFHMHWRWFNLIEKSNLILEGVKSVVFNDNMPYLKGWKNEYVPYAVQGAPMIPSNQKLSIKLNTPSTFTYSVAIEQGIRAGVWQIILHHGAAYAVGNNKIRTALAIDPEARQLTPLIPLLKLEANEIASWPMIYFCFRYGYLPKYFKKPFERIRVTSIDLARKG